VRRADVILVVQDGQIVQRGTHQELLAVMSHESIDRREAA
jgi:ABC-type multidrug transport system fused ATPase/permease subunit